MAASEEPDRSPSSRDETAIGLALLARRAVDALPEALVRIEGREVRFKPLGT